MVKEAVGRIDTDQIEGNPIKEETAGSMDQLLAAMKNMERVISEFEKTCGRGTGARAVSIPSACESLEIKNGRLILDIAGNSGVIAYVD